MHCGHGFLGLSEKSVMWPIPVLATSYLVTLSYVSWPSQSEFLSSYFQIAKLLTLLCRIPDKFLVFRSEVVRRQMSKTAEPEQWQPASRV